jgi:hypothetical protein
MSETSPPTTDLVRQEALTWPERAKALIVTTDEEYAAGATLLQEIKSLRNQVNAAFDPIIKAAHATHKKAISSKKEVEAPLETAERAIKGTMGEWAAEKERLRLQAEREAAEAARKAQDALDRAEALKTKVARERAAEAARAAQIEKEETSKVAAAASKTKAKGVSTSKRYSAQVHDLGALIKFVSANPSFRNLLEPNMTALNGLARAQKDHFSIPGVRAVGEVSVSVR